MKKMTIDNNSLDFGDPKCDSNNTAEPKNEKSNEPHTKIFYFFIFLLYL